MARLIRHAIDIANRQRISGWCYSRIRRTRPVTLIIFSGTEKIGEVKADTFRQDLLDLGVHPTGKCGFCFDFPDDFVFASKGQIRLVLKGRFSHLEKYNYNELAEVDTRENLPLVFMHIPKTAGTSFNTFVRQYFSDTKTVTHIETLNAESIAELKQYQYVAGHCSFGQLIRDFSPEKYAYYSIIREPYSHLHSHLNWIRGIGADPASSFFTKHPGVIQKLALRLNNKDIDIETILKDLAQNPEGFELDFFDNLQTRYFLDYRPERVEEQHLKEAIDNTKYFDSIGVTEEYDRFIRHFCRSNELIFIEQEKSLNRSKYAPLYDHKDERIRHLVKPLVFADQLLYKHIKNEKSP